MIQYTKEHIGRLLDKFIAPHVCCLVCVALVCDYHARDGYDGGDACDDCRQSDSR